VLNGVARALGQGRLDEARRLGLLAVSLGRLGEAASAAAGKDAGGGSYTLNDMVRVIFDAGYRTEVMRVDRDAEEDEDKALYWRLNLESCEADGRRQVELKTEGWREGRADLRAALGLAAEDETERDGSIGGREGSALPETRRLGRHAGAPVGGGVVRFGDEGQFAGDAADRQSQRQGVAGQEAQGLVALVGDVPAQGLEGFGQIGTFEAVNIVPVIRQHDRFGGVAGQAEQGLGQGVDLGEFVAGVGIGDARLHQRLQFQIINAGQVDQAAQGSLGHEVL
jgi:hypothetical protein